MPNGRRTTKTFDLRADAQAWGRARESEIDAGTWSTAVNRKLTLAEYAPSWLDAQQWEPSTRDNHDRLHILPSFGSQPMSTITNTQARAWVTDLSRSGSAPRSVKSKWTVADRVRLYIVLFGVGPSASGLLAYLRASLITQILGALAAMILFATAQLVLWRWRSQPGNAAEVE